MDLTTRKRLDALVNDIMNLANSVTERAHEITDHVPAGGSSEPVPDTKDEVT